MKSEEEPEPKAKAEAEHKSELLKNKFLNDFLENKRNDEIYANFPEDYFCEEKDWLESIEKIACEKNNLEIDFRSTKILMCAINGKMNDSDFKAKILQYKLENKYTYTIICDFKVSDQEILQNHILKYKGIYKAYVYLGNNNDNNEIHCVFDDPITAYKFTKSYYKELIN